MKFFAETAGLTSKEIVGGFTMKNLCLLLLAPICMLAGGASARRMATRIKKARCEMCASEPHWSK